VEASTIPATAVLAPPQQRARVSAGPLLRLRSDEQLVKLFRAGNEEAFRVIHDRYRPRLFAYARQMLAGSRPDAEDALQDVFVRAYAALRANDREISLRAWLYRIAHNRCIDEIRRPAPPPPETFELIRLPANDPISATEQRESLRRLVEDVRRLPEQQRSALLMREISGMSYDGLATALDVTVPAVKSLLVRARIGLAQASEARDTACVTIREELADAQERGVRASGLAKRHLHDCAGCRAYRGELRATHERFAALVPALGPVALAAKLLGIGGGGAGAGAAGGGAAAAASAGAAAGGGALGVSVSHVAAVVAVVVGAGGAVEVQQTLDHHHRHHPAAVVRSYAAPPAASPSTPASPADAGPPTAVKFKAHPQDASTIVDPSATPDPAVVTPDPAAEEPGNGGAAPPPELSEEPAGSTTTPGDTTTPVEPPTDANTTPPTGDPTTAPATDPSSDSGSQPVGQQAGASAPSAPAPTP